MKFNPEEIIQIASTIFETALAMPIQPFYGDLPKSTARATAACIQITGAWNGAVVLDCPVDVARLAASVMFSSEAAKVSVTDMQDAVAELVNMVGGNFKALLPEKCFLSLPAVVEGGDYSHRIPGSTLLGQARISCQGHPVSITLLEKSAEKRSAA